MKMQVTPRLTVVLQDDEGKASSLEDALRTARTRRTSYDSSNVNWEKAASIAEALLAVEGGLHPTVQATAQRCIILARLWVAGVSSSGAARLAVRDAETLHEGVGRHSCALGAARAAASISGADPDGKWALGEAIRVAELYLSRL
ncbi:MAG: hypothetical protein Q7S54_01480 [bacterium]|nr:hypothetical protein [bacterium]